MVLAQAAILTQDKAVRFAALVHDLGKAITPIEHLPKHHGHGQKGLPIIKALCERLRIPNEFRDLALIVSDQHQNVHQAFKLRPETIIKIFDKADFWRKPERLKQLVQAVLQICAVVQDLNIRITRKVNTLANVLQSRVMSILRQLFKRALKGRK